MASVCMPQAGYHQQQQQQQQHFQLFNGNMLLQQTQQQQQQQYSKKFQSIAPAAAPKVLGNSNLQNIQPVGSNVGPMLPRKKYTYNNMPYGEQLPSVARRNARERNRVKQVNNGFANLRQHLPQTVINTLSHGGRGASKKLSKVDTLRIAVEYIRGLQDLLDDSQPNRSMDECSNDDSSYDYASVDSPAELGNYQQLSHAYHSEASVSPAPSYSDSDISSGGINYMQPLNLEQQPQQPQQQQQFKCENFDDFEQLQEDEQQASDEELLDVIFSWQEQ